MGLAGIFAPLFGAIGAEMRAVTVGILTGLALSFVSMRFLASQLWQISPHDPLTLAVVIGILIVVGLVASYIPSLSAMRVNPVETLRAD